MALAYILMALVIIVVNIEKVPSLFCCNYSRSFFGFDQAAGGIMGGIVAAITNGAKRGLFSNEAGMGSALMLLQPLRYVTPYNKEWYKL